MAEDAHDNNNKSANNNDRRPSSEGQVNAHQRSNSSSAKENKHHDSEPNPFERSFSGTAGSDGHKQILPGVGNLTSPAQHGHGMSQAPGWSSYGSLRNGPLSPAMLLGPSGLAGFDGTLRTGLTPNESSIRTGLTPKGEPWSGLGSPSALFNHFGGTGTGLTPGGNLSFLSGPGGSNLNESMFTRPHPPSHLGQDNGLQAPGHNGSMNGGQDAETAANGLYLLSQHAQPGMHQHQDDLMRQATVNNAKHAGGIATKQEDFNISPAANRRGRRKSSFEASASPEDTKPPTKRGKKSFSMPKASDPGMESDDNQEIPDDKNETEEQKRKNFLERNRQAALKCRQRKKQWLQNLQSKVEYYGNENEKLTGQVTTLREEILSLKTMLLAHKECPVARSNSIGGVSDMQHLQQGLQY